MLRNDVNRHACPSHWKSVPNPSLLLAIIIYTDTSCIPPATLSWNNLATSSPLLWSTMSFLPISPGAEVPRLGGSFQFGPPPIPRRADAASVTQVVEAWVVSRVSTI